MRQFLRGGGEGDKVVGVPFLGTAEEALSDATGRLADIMERPSLYQLTPEQAGAIAGQNKRDLELLQYANTEFGTKIREFSGEPGSAYLPHAERVVKGAPKVAGQFQRVAGSASKERAYPTIRARIQGDKTFVPDWSVNNLLDEGDRFKVAAVGGETFRKAVGGLTKLEAMWKTHPELVKRMVVAQAKLRGIQGSLRTVNTRLAGEID